MRPRRFIQIALLILSVLVLLTGMSFGKARKTSAKSTSVSSKSSPATVRTAKTNSRSKKARTSKKSRSARVRGQQNPDSDRTREIQAALIREHYLSGEPTGSWDERTKAALVKFQKDNGWQSRVVPDSRALIKLGLGPSREGLLNPDTAVITLPDLAGDNASQPDGAAN